MKEKHPAVYMIGNTHFDPVWLWTWDEGMASIRSTLRAALARMDEDPDFRYSFSCPPVFRWIEETEPELFDEIRARVKEGRFSLDEGMWLQPDCFSASGESYARQCLYGQTYLLKTFGVYSDTAFNADCFGAPAMMPQILKKSGIPYAVFGRPDNQDLPLSDPYFAWQAPDGSTVLSVRISDAANPWARELSAEIDRALAYGDKTGNDAMLVFGVTNHGGAPTKRDIRTIREKNGESGGRVFFGTTGDFFRAAEKAGRKPADTVGEIMIRYFGVFSDMPEIKKMNREAEYACLSAERTAVLDALQNRAAIPYDLLNRAWENVLFNQFHDILGGSSIKDAYTDAEQRYGHVFHETRTYLHTVLQRMTRKIALPAEDGVDWNLVVWNLHPFPVSEPIEAEVQWAWEFDWYRGEVCVTDDTGREIPCQCIQPREAIPGFRSRFVFRAEIPSFGYRVFRVHRKRSDVMLPGSAPAAEPDPDQNTIENGEIRVSVSKEDGSVTVMDMKTGKILLSACAAPVVLADESDVWAFNFSGYGPAEQFRADSIRILECGTWRARIRVRYLCGLSVLDQDIFIYRDCGAVEGRFRLVWQEMQKTCKLRFAMPVMGDVRVRASSPYGITERPADGKEKPVGPFITVSDQADGSGFALISDSLFAYDAEQGDGVVRLSMTAVRSPVWGDLRIEPLNPQDLHSGIGEGVHEGRWKLIPYQKQPDDAVLWNLADAFLSPSVIIDEANHDGTMPLSSHFAAVNGDGCVRLTVIKSAEDQSGDIILRLQNTADREAQAGVTLDGKGTTGLLRFDPYEIKTVRFGERAENADILER